MILNAATRTGSSTLIQKRIGTGHRGRAPEDKHRALPGQEYARIDERYRLLPFLVPS
jgi:hypothetical protein